LDSDDEESVAGNAVAGEVTGAGRIKSPF